MTNHQRFARFGRGGCVLFALTIGGQAASGGEVPSSAYFSLEGDINAVGDQYDFTFDLTRSVSSAEDLRFLGLGDTGTTNAAGDSITNVNFDSDLHLYDSLNALRGQDDESGPNLDALLTWAPTTIDTPLNPDPLPADSYRLNIQEYLNNNTGPFAVDLIGPADALVFTGGTPVAGGTVRSLKFGTDIGIAAAVYNHSAASGTFTLQDQLVVAQTGGGILNLSGGTITVGGLTTIKSQGSINQTNGTFNTNGGLLVDGGIYTRTNGTFNLAAGQTLTVQNGGLFEWGSNDLFLNIAGSAVQVSGAGSVLRNTTAGDNSVRVQNGVSVDVELGGALEASYLLINQGSVTIDGSGSTLDLSSASTPGFIHSLGTTSGTIGSLTLSNNATGTYVGSSPSRLLVGRNGGTGILDVLSGADLTLEELDMDETGTSTVTVDGSGSTITQAAGSALTVGSASGSTGTLNVQNAGVFNASHTGVLTVNATGSLNADSGTFNANGTNSTSGGTVNTSGAVNVTGSGLINLDGGTPGISDLVPAGTGGSLIVMAGTVDLSGTGDLLMRGGRGGKEEPGATGGSLTISGGALTAVDDTRLLLSGGLGGNNTGFGIGTPGLPGGSGGTASVSAGSLTLGDNSVMNLNGGRGGALFTGSSGVIGSNGGTGGSMNVNGGDVVLNDNTTVNLNGGNGWGLNIAGYTDGDGGDAGQLVISAGSVTVNGGLVTLRGGSHANRGLSNPGVDGAHGLIDITGGSFTMNGGEVFTGTFQRSGGGVFNHSDGKLTVSGGSFNPGTAILNINGALAAQRPTLVLANGATTVGVTDITIGNNNRGRMELLSGTTQTLSGTIRIGNQSTGDGQVLVDASTWTITGVNSDLAVGEGGLGELTVSNNGVVSVSDDFIAGRGGLATGIVNIDSGGSLTVGNRLVVGETGAGSVIISGGSTATSTNELNIGWVFGSDGSLVVDDLGSVLNANTHLNVGGTNGGAGGTGLLSMTDNPTVNVADTLRVYGGGTVGFESGTLTADTIDHTHSGAFNFNGGVLHVNTFDGTLDQQGGTLAPGSSPGKTVITGGYGLTAGTLKIELGGTTAGVDFDQVEVLGFAQLFGDLDVSLINGFVPTYGDSFDFLFTWGGVTDAFNSISLPAVPVPNAAWSLFSDGFVLFLNLNSTLVGDLNNDGFVGIGDLNIVLGNWNQNVAPGELLLGDPSGDGFVGIADLNVVLGNWNAGTPPPINTSANIPEPATGVLLVLGALALGRRETQR